MIRTMMTIAAIAAQAAPSPPPAPPPVVVTTPAVDPALLTKAQQLLQLVHLDQQYDGLLGRMIPVMTTNVFNSLKDNVKIPASVRNRLAEPAQLAEAERIFADEVSKGFKAHYPAMRLATAREYAAAFTGDELDQLVRFYQSPVGQKALATMPALQAKLLPIGMAAGAEVGKAAIERTFERMNLAPPARAT